MPRRVGDGVSGIRADVAAQPVGLVNRHKELVAAFVFDEQEFALQAFQRAADQAFVAADAVIDMHDPVARFQIGIEGFGCFGRRAVLLAGPRAFPSKYFAVGQQVQALTGRQRSIQPSVSVPSINWGWLPSTRPSCSRHISSRRETWRETITILSPWVEASAR